MDTKKIDNALLVQTQSTSSKKPTGISTRKKTSKKYNTDKIEEKSVKKDISSSNHFVPLLSKSKKIVSEKKFVHEAEAFLFDKMKSFGVDQITHEPFDKLMRSSFRRSAPYVIVQIHNNNGDVFYLDGKTLATALLRFPPVANEVCSNLFTVPVKNMQYIGMVPWDKDGFLCGFIDSNSTKEDIQRHDFLYLSSSSAADWVRGVSYARFSLGLNVKKDEKIAEFLYSKIPLRQKKVSLNAALVHAAHSMDQEIIKFLLAKGADTAPCVQSDDFLPLTIAAKAGRVETVRLLLQAGADPRQQASSGHGTALSWSQKNSEIKKLLLEHLNGKDINIVLRPDLNGNWVEHTLGKPSAGKDK